jgi:uncharacterized protein YbjT (DUF2867 family)
MILVTGANGNVGRELVRTLVAKGVAVRALVRPTGTEAQPLPAGVHAVAGDLNDPAGLDPALKSADGLFLLPGYADMPGILGRARKAGVKHVVQLSGMSADGPDTDNAITRYMAESERAVRDCGIAWTIVRPAAFMTNAFRWLPQLRAGDVLRLPFAHVRTATIDPADIAEVAALALVTRHHEGRTYPVSGPQSLTPADQVAILGRALGRNLRFEAQPDDEARTEMSKSTPAQYVDAFFRFYVDGTLDESKVLPTVQAVTGRPPRTFAQWAADHVSEFS